MKRVEFKVLPGRGGWLRTSIVPIKDKQTGTFGIADAIMIFALVVGIMTVARVLLAH